MHQSEIPSRFLAILQEAQATLMGNRPRALSLFSGIGAHDLGLQWAGFDIVGQVEIDDYCQAILRRWWPAVPKWRDITTVSTDELRRLAPDLITGGFPCQDISTAGKQEGLDGKRSILWRELCRIVNDLRPRWVLIENVPALRTKGADTILDALEGYGYTCWPLVVGAFHTGAPHERRRAWIVAHHNRVPRSAGSDQAGSGLVEAVAGIAQLDCNGESPLANIDSDQLWEQPWRRCGTCGQDSPFSFPAGVGAHQHEWEQPRVVESKMGARAYGASNRVALRAIGNANPAPVVAMIGRAILHADSVANKP